MQSRGGAPPQASRVAPARPVAHCLDPRWYRKAPARLDFCVAPGRIGGSSLQCAVIGRPCILAAVGLLTLAWPVNGATPGTVPRLAVGASTADVVIDGRLDESAWASAALVRRPDAGRSPRGRATLCADPGAGACGRPGARHRHRMRSAPGNLDRQLQRPS